MTEINANNLPAILRAIARYGTPKHLVLRGYTAKGAVKQYPFTIKVYGSRSRDIQETVEQEQPYSHYLGVYNADVAPQDLADDIRLMIEDKYAVRGVV